MQFSVTDNHIELYPNSFIITGLFEEEGKLFPTTSIINDISKGYIRLLLSQNIFHTSINNTILLYDVPYLSNRHIVLVGCGTKKKFKERDYREKINTTLSMYTNILLIDKLLFFLSEIEIEKYNNYWKIRQTIEIINEKLYTFNQFKSNKDNSNRKLKEIILSVPKTKNTKHYKTALQDSIAIINGINIAKNLSNMPPNVCTPEYFSEQVNKFPVSDNNISIEIIDETKMQKLGMTAYLAVGKGSKFPPVMPIIKYYKHPKGQQIPPIILIGKGLTFDSGGISIKPAHKMDEMKYDMCGAAAVYAIMHVAAQLNLPLNIIGILAICENMISNTAFRPGDILKTLSGKTVEILNTDAEGRIILCDALTYAERYHPECVIDIATLTGACVVALGHHFNGLMSNHENLANDLIYASKQSRDHTWRLPLNKIFENTLQSKHADIKNVSNHSGGAITAGCFLKKFADKYNWAHLDIAGTAWISNEQNNHATGRPVSLLSQFLINKTLLVYDVI